MSYRDDLLAAQQQSAQQALQNIVDDAGTAQQDYQQALDSGNQVDAAHYLRQLARLGDEYQRIAAAVGAGQQQPPQTQSGFTPAQEYWLRNHPEYANDRRRFSEIYRAHIALVNRGLDPNSAQYVQALDFSTGEPVLEESKPLDATEAAAISGVDPDTYNKNAADLLTLKSMGLYRDGR